MSQIAVLIEKVFWTYVQAFLAALTAPGVDNTATAAAVAAIPAALTVVANGLPAVPGGLPFSVDFVLRVVRTYAVSFIGFLVAVVPFRLDYSIGKSAAIAAIPAAIAVVKCAAASKLGTSNSAATLPESLDPASK